MKKNNYFNFTMISILVIMGVIYLTGCFTSATAFTKTTHPDGTITESEVSIVGTGDKASTIAAEGLFADGTVEDLGAGVATANASQESTGIEGALAGVGDLMAGMANMLEAYQGRQPTIAPVVPVPVPDTSSETTPGATKATGQSIIKGDGAPEIVILGNRASCSLCNKLWSGLDVASLSASACDANVIDADKTDNPTVYSAKRPQSAFNWPHVRIYVAGNLVDEFSARGLTQTQIAAKAKTAIGECSDTE